MQRHKEPLDFVESPLNGAKHIMSPVFAAEKPCLVEESIPGRLLNAKWVSPQFPKDNDYSSRQGRRQKSSRTRQAREKQRQKDIVHLKGDNQNAFPSLQFSDGKSTRNSKTLRQNEDHSSRCRTRQPLCDATSEYQVSNNNKYLFSLGTPKPRRIMGQVLVPETPEGEMIENRMLKRRRRFMKNNH